MTRALEFSTAIMKGDDGTEQRWMQTTGRESWMLAYPRLTLAQRDTILSAFEAAKGSFDRDLNFAFEGTTYTGVRFADDKLAFTERSAKVWSGTVKLTQVFRAPDTGSLGSDFPTLTSTAPEQYPFTHEKNFDTVAAQTEGGRKAYYNRAAALRAWSVGGSAISDAEALAIWDYFRKAHGRHAAFAYTDVDSATRYTNCRFGADVLEWRYSDRRLNAIDAQVVTVL